MTVIARMRCISRTESNRVESDGSTTIAASVHLMPLCEDDPAKRHPENEIFGKYTPSGQVQMYITNPEAHQQFESGKDYYIRFDRCPE